MNSNIEISTYQKTRVITVVIISLIIAAIHGFRIGSYLNGELYIFYYSYASDVIIPFGIYFLLAINEIQIRFLRKKYIKAILVFGASTFTEIMQTFGFYFLGVTFDLFDILAFAIGTLLAVIFDKYILERFIPFWKLPQLEK